MAEKGWVKKLAALGLVGGLVAIVVIGPKDLPRAMHFVGKWVGKARGVSGSAIEKTFESALGPVCSVILITGAGGMFGGVLRSSGIGDALADVLTDLGIPAGASEHPLGGLGFASWAREVVRQAVERMRESTEKTRPDLWAVFNRVQENLVKGGLNGRTANGRNQRTRPVQGIDQNLRLNRALWLLAEGMRQLKA